ncbi:hypothetical protein FA95DRAFT_1583295 [Auriscalpium vulgare]|uniref:Uncharacterized protein n=1 Tax=Auriscalpium vulgare TaxID=40419 RepID=A0ACB8RQ33_9AGAM|nr:hypothetical protein FA95DRAFT_1583295 [Auriscalpium vulgare]
MELGSNIAAKLEPYVLMSKSAKGAAAAKLVTDATSAPGVYFFSELLEVPNVKELATSELHASSYALLEVFAYSTYQDYLERRATLPDLTPAQALKLKHLSLLSYSMQNRIIPYSFLLTALAVPTIRALEDLIIDAIYLDILHGKLDQKHQQFEVEYTVGRDVPPAALPDLYAALESWSTTTAQTLATLDAKIALLADQNVATRARGEEHDRVLNGYLKDLADKKGGGAASNKRAAGGAGRKDRDGGRENRDDEMDVDSEIVEAKGKNRKASQEISGKTRSKRNRM